MGKPVRQPEPCTVDDRANDRLWGENDAPIPETEDTMDGSRMCESPGPGEQKVLLYVSTRGNDTWSGTLPEPNATRTDGPLLTLHRARDLAREAKAEIVDKQVFTIRLRLPTALSNSSTL